jgi:hypothetical protein
MANLSTTERASRALVDAAEALRINAALDGRSQRLSDLMDGTASSFDMRRAFVDVTTADVPGLMPPQYVAVRPIPSLPLFGLAEPLDNVSSVLAGSLDALPTAILDPAEKAVIGGGKISVSPKSRPVHLAAAGADLSTAVWARTEPPMRDAFASYCAIAVWRALEGAVLSDISAQCTAGSGTTPADVVTALGAVAAAYAPGNLILAGSTAFAKMLVAYPLGLGDPDSPTSWGANIIPVAAPSFASNVIVTNRSNIHVLASALRSLLAGVPAQLGVDVGIYCEAVGLVDVKAGAIEMTLA